MTAVAADAVQPGRAKAIGWSVAFLLLGFAFTLLFYAIYLWLRFGGIIPGTASGNNSVEYLLVAGTSQFAGFALATWLVGFRVLRLDARDLRWSASGARGSGFAAGLALGAVAALAALIFAMPVGGGWTSDSGTLSQYGTRVALTFAALAIPALSEEVAFRGLPLILLARAFGRLPAIVAMALVFAAAHMLNPNVTPLALVNIAVAGILLGVAYFAPGGIWTAFGAHLGWNAALAAADAPVSGLPFTIPFINHHAGGPAWLTGGTFGPEGGLTATIAISLATIVAWRWARKDTA